MISPHHYSKPTTLTQPVSNNAFNYQQRKSLGSACRLTIPPLALGHPTLAKTANHVCLEVIDDQNQLSTNFGLINFLLHQTPTSNHFLIDNHNHALYFWYHQTRQIKTPLTLVHIDQHKDNRRPQIAPPPNPSLDQIFYYTNTHTNIGNFIPPAQQLGIIDEIIFITSQHELNNFQFPSKPFIVDIDLDFFAPELDYVDNSQKIKLIRNLLPKAHTVTIATSPYFINQQLAFNYLHQIYQN